ncbi:uncharacterized protein LOC5571052 isoform X2 [Aedes aegypti]|uniref:Uncharacterized protein n=1 Tax=Aedes aegypti TaxID=7159 RepID=A0A6I8TQ88_AEDAE|nr:uncharacterized protein LOC5571052 isoform X2 [Aedes aegypti]
MDEYVKHILRKWELPELIPTFEDEEVNEKAFKCLTDDIIRELIPKLGKRAIFNSAYRAYREALEKQTVTIKPIDQSVCASENISSVLEIKPDLAVVNLPESNSSRDEPLIPQNDNFKIEVQAPEEAYVTNAQGLLHEEPKTIAALENGSSLHVSQDVNFKIESKAPEEGTTENIQGMICKESETTAALSVDDQCIARSHSKSDISTEENTFEECVGNIEPLNEVLTGSDINTPEICHQTTVVHDNLATRTALEYTTKEITSMDIQESNDEKLETAASASSVGARESDILTSHEEAVASDVETCCALQITDNLVSPTQEVSISNELEDHASINKSEFLEELNQLIDDAQPSHISFCISALSDPSKMDHKCAESLRQLLSTSKTLAHLLGKPFLTRSIRNALAEEIVGHLCATNGDVLSNELLRSWARAVEMVFSQEVNQLYFRESEDGYSCGGKLVQYYQHRKDTNADTANRESG